LSSDPGISRVVFSLIRSGEIRIGAAAAPLVATLLDRHGGRWLMAAGGLISGAGFLLLGQAQNFSQFAFFRWLLVSPGDSLMESMVVNVSISRWFIRMRGRALALAGMGHGLAKVGMPILAASLILHTGWRGVLAVFAWWLWDWSSDLPCFSCAAALKTWDSCRTELLLMVITVYLLTKKVQREPFEAQSVMSRGVAVRLFVLAPSGLSLSLLVLLTSV